MKTKSIQAIFLALILTLVWCSAVWAGDRVRNRSKKNTYKQTERVNKRTHNVRRNKQTNRILKGVRHDDINRNEIRHLGKEQRRIDQAYRRALSDGRLSRYERQRIHKMQDRASRHIYKFRHNHAFPKQYRYHPQRNHKRPAVHNHYERHYYGSHRTKTGPFNDYEVSGVFAESGWQVAFSIGGDL